MAAQQQQLLAQVQNQTSAPLPQWDKQKLFGDIPSADGKMKLAKFIQWSHGISRGGSSLGSNFEGADPGFGGGGNATIMAQHTDRNTAIMQRVIYFFPRSNLDAIFTTHAKTHHLLKEFTFGIISKLTTSFTFVLQTLLLKHTSTEFPNTLTRIPPDKQSYVPGSTTSSELVLNFKNMITSHNPDLHPNMNIPTARIISIFEPESR